MIAPSVMKVFHLDSLDRISLHSDHPCSKVVHQKVSICISGASRSAIFPSIMTSNSTYGCAIDGERRIIYSNTSFGTITFLRTTTGLSSKEVCKRKGRYQQSLLR